MSGPGLVRRVELRAAIRERDGDPRCHYCGWLLAPGEATLEHIWPRSFGHFDEPWNVVAACPVCNGLMGDRLVKCFCSVCAAALWTALSRLGWIGSGSHRVRPRYGFEALVQRLEDGASLVGSHNRA